MYRSRLSIKINNLCNMTLALSFIVIILGAFTRLSDAGLGCPDWPGCYGNFIAPNQVTDLINPTKAWIEMIHRYAAGILGLFIFYLSFIHCKNNNHLKYTLIPTILLSILIILQAALGMWTVTLKLYPIVVMAHLLGGMFIISLIWIIKQKNNNNTYYYTYYNKTIKNISNICTLILIMQIALGAWTSANYASLVCGGFPYCQGKLLPKMDFITAFSFFKIGVFDSPGIPLENTARVTINMAHRIGALVNCIFIVQLFIMSYTTIQAKPIRKYTLLLMFLLLIQISLGIANVLYGLPMFIALLHNGCAIFLLLTVIKIRLKYAPNFT